MAQGLKTCRGGTQTEKLLWSNPNPTTSLTSIKTINYDGSYNYIKIIFKTSSGGSTTFSYMLSNDELYDFRYGQDNKPYIECGWNDRNTGVEYTRPIFYDNELILTIGAGSVGDNQTIPLSIYGIN